MHGIHSCATTHGRPGSKEYGRAHGELVFPPQERCFWRQRTMLRCVRRSATTAISAATAGRRAQGRARPRHRREKREGGRETDRQKNRGFPSSLLLNIWFCRCCPCCLAFCALRCVLRVCVRAAVLASETSHGAWKASSCGGCESSRGGRESVLVK
jgi:hypothetical protein